MIVYCRAKDCAIKFVMSVVKDIWQMFIRTGVFIAGRNIML
jgi:hypothetical protein